jgi:hypothetical protein
MVNHCQFHYKTGRRSAAFARQTAFDAPGESKGAWHGFGNLRAISPEGSPGADILDVLKMRFDILVGGESAISAQEKTREAQRTSGHVHIV